MICEWCQARNIGVTETYRSQGFTIQQELMYPFRKMFWHTSEAGITEQLCKFLKRDFIIATEFWGIHLATQKRIRSDILIKPKPHLIDAGFDPVTLVVEVKKPHETEGSQRYHKAVAQANSYLNSDFGEWGIPAFGLIYPEPIWLNAHEVVNMAYYLRVGSLIVGSRLDKGDVSTFGWQVNLNGCDKYFSNSNNMGLKHYGRRFPMAYIGSKFSGYIGE